MSKLKKKYLYYICIAFAGMLLLSFIIRNTIFHYILDKKINAFNREYHAELKIDKARIKGFSSLMLTGIMLRPENGDTLLIIDSAYITSHFLKLLSGHLSVIELVLSNTRVNFMKKDSLTNYLFLLEHRSKDTTRFTPAEKSNYARRSMKILDAVFDFLPSRLQIHNFTISSKTNDHLLRFHIDQFDIRDQEFSPVILVAEDGSEHHWKAEGRLDKSNRQIEAKLYCDDAQKLSIPFIKYRWNADMNLDTIQFSIAQKRAGSDMVSLTGYSAIHGMELKHARISADKVIFDDAAIRYTLNIGPDYFELDSATQVVFNRLTFNPYIKYRPKPSKQISLRIDKKDFPAQDLFSSLPPGLFYVMQNMKVNGNLNFDLNFHVDLSIPDSLKFDISLKPRHFSVVSYGNAGLTKINDTFSYTAYEKGEALRTFMVGPQNPDFRSLDKISPYLKVSVLNSEDAFFYQHRGFIPEAFRESIITNIKQGRFARGGSTITMQLVKNVYLNRNKTIARKLEEAMIVWFLENFQLSTKDRMYEVYLNIIEWGPMVYGANEAARFYFNKDASKLTLAESIFLASVIPHPKWFKYSFDENGHLRDFIVNFYQRMSEKMLKKEQITQADFDHLVPNVELKGPAKLLLKKPDREVIDTSNYLKFDAE